MGLTQRRFGPVNLGVYGFLAAIINGCNLIITQYILPKHHFLLSFFNSINRQRRVYSRGFNESGANLGAPFKSGDSL
jgi:hypothetical protein